jgi:hypothetical protein
VAKGELDRPTFSVRAPPKSVAHVRIGHRAPQSACAEGPPSACADRPLSACADRPPSATERHRAPPSACADRPPSTCAAEHFSRPQGGFGGSPPDIPLACPLPPQKDTPFLRSLSEPVPAEKGHAFSALAERACFRRRRTRLLCARFARAPSTPPACPIPSPKDTPFRRSLLSRPLHPTCLPASAADGRSSVALAPSILPAPTA